MPVMPFSAGALRGPGTGGSPRWPERGRRLLPALLAALTFLPFPAFAQSVQISNLSDIAFGAITNLGSDLSQSQTVCAYASGLPPRYAIVAKGSGTGNAFTLSNGVSTLHYEVQWNASAGQTSGTALSAGAALSGQSSNAVLPTCTLGLTPSGSLTVILRAAELSAARAGSYTGALTLLISPN